MINRWFFFHQTDKASTLEEVIQYVKSLQHQLQVLHMLTS
jgi:hypothetical protein